MPDSLTFIMRRTEDPFAWIKASEEKRLNRYREPREARNPELWVSNKYNFSDPQTRLEDVPEEGCTVGGCISAIQKSWNAIHLANEGRRRNEDEPIEDIQIRINRIQKNLGIQPYRFRELDDIGYYDELAEDEARQREGYDDEPIITTEEEAELRREEIEVEKETNNWKNSGRC